MIASVTTGSPPLRHWETWSTKPDISGRANDSLNEEGNGYHRETSHTAKETVDSRLVDIVEQEGSVEDDVTLRGAEPTRSMSLDTWTSSQKSLPLFTSLSVSSERHVPCRKRPEAAVSGASSRIGFSDFARILRSSLDELGNRSTEQWKLPPRDALKIDRSRCSSPTSPRYHQQTCFCYLLFSFQCTFLTEESDSFRCSDDVMLRRQRPLEPHNRRHWVPRRVSNQRHGGANAPEALKRRGQLPCGMEISECHPTLAIAPHAIEPAGDGENVSRITVPLSRPLSPTLLFHRSRQVTAYHI